MWHVRFSGERKGGTLNASVHDEAANYGDRVCHLILCSFHHNLPHCVQRKAHWRLWTRTAAWNITQRSTYGLLEHFSVQAAYGLIASILKLKKYEASQMYGIVDVTVRGEHAPEPWNRSNWSVTSVGRLWFSALADDWQTAHTHAHTQKTHI